MLGAARTVWKRVPRVRRARRLILGGLMLLPSVTVLGAMAEAGVRARLRPDLLHRPVVFYARPTVFAPGLRVNATNLEANLDRLGYRRVHHRRVGTGEYYRDRRSWVIGRRGFRISGELRQPTTFVVRVDGWTDRVGSVHTDAGRTLQYATLEPERIHVSSGAGAAISHTPVPLKAIPGVLLDAVLTVEDRDFFRHDGVDLSRIVGAALANARARGIREGASTITQQLAKNLFLSPRRTPLRKLRELCMAIALEERYTKEEILTAYLNVIYMGQDGGRAIHGVAAASSFYTGRDVSQLSLADAALLAGMIRGPNLYAPARHPERARARRDLVLRLMHERGLITEAARDAALAAALPEPRDAGTQPETRYFTDFVTAQLRAAVGNANEARALDVFTSLDPALQSAATRAVAEELPRLEQRYPFLRRADSPVQAAVIAIAPRTGEVLAMVGGREYGVSQFNRAVDAHRQPGSAFKPIVALTALTAGRASGTAQGAFTLASILEDTPLSVATPNGTWQPVNYDRRFSGSITLREALERSLNVPFARLGLAVGAEQIVATARRLGITSPLRAVPSLALGSSEVTPLELARAYGVLGAEGVLAPVNPVLAAVDADGNLLAQFDAGTTRAYSEEEAYLVTSALLGAVERGTGRGLRAAGYHGPFAAKSGTTNDYRDGWFVGYTPDIAVAVWVGFDDGHDLGLPGSRLALPILGRFLALAFDEEGAGTFSRPWGLEAVEIDPATGLRAGWGCGGRRELFLPGTAPTQRCDPFRRDYSFRIPERRTDARTLLRGLLRHLDRAVR